MLRHLLLYLLLPACACAGGVGHFREVDVNACRLSTSSAMA